MNKILRKGHITWERHYRLAGLKCLMGIHCGWRINFYDDTFGKFLYCPNCHQERGVIE